MDARNLLSLSGVLLVLGAAGYYWGMGHTENNVLHTDDTRRPDYVVSHIRSHETDTNGQLLRRLNATEVRHYSSPTEEAEIDSPTLTLYERGHEAWQLRATRGHSQDQNATLQLSGGVHAERRDPAAIPIRFDTAALTVLPQEKRISSTRTVNIQSAQGQLSSQGFSAGIKTGDLQLTKKVTGTYAPAPH